MLTIAHFKLVHFLGRKQEKGNRKKDAEEGHDFLPKTTNKGHFLVLLNVSESYFIGRNNVDS